MSSVELDQVVELAFRLTIAEQAKLLERVAAHLAREVGSTQETITAESLVGRTFEVWSPQDEGGAVAALNRMLDEHKAQKRAQSAG